MKLLIEVVPVSAWNVGLLVLDAATREPVETLSVCPLRELVATRARLLDRWSSDPAVTEIFAPALPSWTRDRYDVEPSEGAQIWKQLA